MDKKRKRNIWKEIKRNKVRKAKVYIEIKKNLIKVRVNTIEREGRLIDWYACQERSYSLQRTLYVCFQV